MDYMSCIQQAREILEARPDEGIVEAATRVMAEVRELRARVRTDSIQDAVEAVALVRNCDHLKSPDRLGSPNRRPQ